MGSSIELGNLTMETSTMQKRIGRSLKKILILIMPISLASFGCSQSLEQKIGKIQQGMSQQEVIQILGRPEAVDWASEHDKSSMGVKESSWASKWFYGISYLKPGGRTKKGYIFQGNADYYVEILGNSGVHDAGDASLLNGWLIFVRNEDLLKVKSKVDPFYERQFENEKIDLEN
jgi:hypothetical protein